MSAKAKAIRSVLIDEPSIPVSPSLAVAIGLNQAIVLQQLHFLLQYPRNGTMINDVRYIYNTYGEWRRDHFRFWSEPTIIRIFRKLEKDGWVSAIQPRKHDYNRVKYYTINYGKLGPRISSLQDRRDKGKSKRSSRSDHIDQPPDQIDQISNIEQNRPKRIPPTPGQGSGGFSSFQNEKDSSSVNRNDDGTVPGAESNARTPWSTVAMAHPAAAEFLTLAGLKTFPSEGRQRLARSFVKRCDEGTISVRRLRLISTLRDRLDLPKSPETFVESFPDIAAEARTAAQERLAELEQNLSPSTSDPLNLMRSMAGADNLANATTPEELFDPAMSLPFPTWLLLACCIKRGLAVDKLLVKLKDRILNELARDGGAVQFLKRINIDLGSLAVDAVEIESAKSRLLAQWGGEREILIDLISAETAISEPSGISGSEPG